MLLCDDRALKVKKPVRYSFLDYSTPERRRAACEAEVEVNAALAGDLYLGVRELDAGDGATEYAVEMRRYDERSTLAARLAAGTLRDADLDALARVLAGFHRGEPVCRREGAARAYEDRAARDLADLDELLPAGTTAPHRRFAAALVRRHGPALDERARRGLHRDGHGDLRADHVLFEDRVLVIDRIEFDPGLRCADVADDLAFLLMDLEHRDARWAADALAGHYGAAGGDPGDARLRAGLEWRRALVRVKTALLGGETARAETLLDLADRLAWRGRGPLTVAVCGPPASGKSTLAEALARRLELPLVSSDPERKRLVGVAPTRRAGAAAYADDVTARVYAEVAGRAAAEQAAHGGVVVDATFRRRELRARLEQALGPEPLWVELQAPADVLRERSAGRASDPGHVSDADERVALALAATFEPLDELPPERVCRLDAREPTERGLATLARTTDERA